MPHIPLPIHPGLAVVDLLPQMLHGSTAALIDVRSVLLGQCSARFGHLLLGGFHGSRSLLTGHNGGLMPHIAFPIQLGLAVVDLLPQILHSSTAALINIFSMLLGQDRALFGRLPVGELHRCHPLFTGQHGGPMPHVPLPIQLGQAAVNFLSNVLQHVSAAQIDVLPVLRGKCSMLLSPLLLGELHKGHPLLTGQYGGLVDMLRQSGLVPLCLQHLLRRILNQRAVELLDLLHLFNGQLSLGSFYHPIGQAHGGHSGHAGLVIPGHSRPLSRAAGAFPGPQVDHLLHLLPLQPALQLMAALLPEADTRLSLPNNTLCATPGCQKNGLQQRLPLILGQFHMTAQDLSDLIPLLHLSQMEQLPVGHIGQSDDPSMLRRLGVYLLIEGTIFLQFLRVMVPGSLRIRHGDLHPLLMLAVVGLKTGEGVLCRLRDGIFNVQPLLLSELGPTEHLGNGVVHRSYQRGGSGLSQNGLLVRRSLHHHVGLIAVEMVQQIQLGLIIDLLFDLCQRDGVGETQLLCQTEFFVLEICIAASPVALEIVDSLINAGGIQPLEDIQTHAHPGVRGRLLLLTLSGG